ncbi:MAG: AI-2E family transporter, partial [Parcubacteria group bacterium]|nr:AI-2E family transporter [Parcubacteria group bacterium]
MERMSVTVSWTTLWRIFFMLVLAVVLYLAKDILLAFLLAIVISTALDPLVSLLEKKSIPRIIGTLLVFIMFGGLFAVLIYTVVPLAILESSKLLDNIGGLASSIFGASSQRVQMLQSVNQNLNNIGYLLLSGGGSILDAATALIGGAALVISIFVLSFYLTIGRDGVERFLRSVIPEQYEESVLNIYERVRRRTGRWFQ